MHTYFISSYIHFGARSIKSHCNPVRNAKLLPKRKICICIRFCTSSWKRPLRTDGRWNRRKIYIFAWLTGSCYAFAKGDGRCPHGYKWHVGIFGSYLKKIMHKSIDLNTFRCRYVYLCKMCIRFSEASAHKFTSSTRGKKALQFNRKFALLLQRYHATISQR